MWHEPTAIFSFFLLINRLPTKLIHQHQPTTTLQSSLISIMSFFAAATAWLSQNISQEPPRRHHSQAVDKRGVPIDSIVSDFHLMQDAETRAKIVVVVVVVAGTTTLLVTTTV